MFTPRLKREPVAIPRVDVDVVVAIPIRIAFCVSSNYPNREIELWKLARTRHAKIDRDAKTHAVSARVIDLPRVRASSFRIDDV